MCLFLLCTSESYLLQKPLYLCTCHFAVFFILPTSCTFDTSTTEGPWTVNTLSHPRFKFTSNFFDKTTQQSPTTVVSHNAILSKKSMSHLKSLFFKLSLQISMHCPFSFPEQPGLLENEHLFEVNSCIQELRSSPIENKYIGLQVCFGRI